MKRIFTISGLVLLCFFFINSAFAQNLSVKGKVTDAASNETLIGVSVTIKGTTEGTQTDVNGAFSISAPSNATLVISYIGYKPLEVPVNGQTTLDVKLQAQNNALNEVVVVGYGTQKKADVTGAIATVKGADLASQPNPNPVSSLQGKVAGVQIINSGTPGSSPQITLRGLGTIFGSSSPLFVVDGVWYHDIAFLNSNDIETMSVLKDASSEAIYGLEAANGVIIITTKKGKGAARVRYDGYVGFSTPTNLPVMANATQYATMVNEVNAASSLATFANPSSFGTGTDWIHLIVHNAFTQNHNIGVSGSTDKTSYNFSANYFQQDGNIAYNTYNRITTHLYQDVQISKFLKMGYTAILSGDHSKDIPGDIMYHAYVAAPTVPVRYADGTYGDPSLTPQVGNAVNNPQVELDFFNQNTQHYNFNGNAFAEVKFTDYLSFRTSFGGTFAHQEVQAYTPVYAATGGQFNTISTLSKNNVDDRNWIWENTLTFDKTFDKDHHVTVLAGQSSQRYRHYEQNVSAQNVPNDSSGDLYLGLGTNPTVTTPNASLETRESYFGRVNYAYQGKYLLNATVRRDGSSVYSDEHKWGTFPSVGAGWVISNEDFMKDQHIFDNLKLRGSWGEAGNGSITPNLATAVNTQFYSNFGGGLQLGSGLLGQVPPVIYWEKSVGTDVGLEAAFLTNRLTIEADYYIKETQNAVFPVPILLSLGTSSGQITANQANIKNVGWEFTAGWKDHIGKDFSYSVSGNFSINDNKVTSVTSGPIPLYGGGNGGTGGALTTRTIVGQPIGEFYGYQVAGIFQTQQQIDAQTTQTNAKPGDVIYGNNGQKTVIGNPNPKYLYGLNINLKYKQFDFAADLSGVGKVSLYNANESIRFGEENWTQAFYNSRWHGAGTSNTTPSSFLSDVSNSAPNSYYVQSGSYLRIRNVQLGYTLPPSVASSIKMSALRLYISGQNLATFTKYKGFNPEVLSTGTNGINQGIDSGTVPIYAIFNFGVNATF
ncbi:SusC/RagA family TonB-linked outer membrane protein [Mucilaginibacter sp. McL0603]|uniref:SusC/RagA family TonB-linked outer membrane protein n=1 Tax=Mucilaginibacter sp. McL0603 TaxID=3415670 RepID=UPI003CF4DAE7